MKLYKLTKENDRTLYSTQWGPDIEHTADGEGGLCTSHVIHAYRDPRLAVIMNPIHTNFKNPHLWETDGDVCISDSVKVGCTRIKTVKRIDLPEVTQAQKLRFALACAEKVEYLWRDKYPKQYSEYKTAMENKRYRDASAVIFDIHDATADASYAVADAYIYATDVANYVGYAVVYATQADPTLDLIAILDEIMEAGA